MNSSSDEKSTEHPRCGNCRTGRRLRLGIFAAFLLVVGATFGALMSAAIAHGGMGHWGHHRGGIHSVEQAQDRAKDMAAWMSGAIDATPEQAESLSVVFSGFVDRVYPLAEQHRDNRRLLLAELARPSVDPQVLDRVRQAEISLADTASSELVQAMVDLAEVLTPEQRQSLVGMAARMRH